jgi:NAD+ synthase (glutamine-hydrolysing)
MCRLVVEGCKAGNQQVLKDVRMVCADSTYTPESPQEFCGRIFHTCFMGSINSSGETRSRARDLAKAIGAYHTDLNIDSVVNSMTSLFTAVTSFVPKFRLHGGSDASNLAMQNIQARLRMVIAYLFAQLLPTVRKRPDGGSLLVLGSANVDGMYTV